MGPSHLLLSLVSHACYGNGTECNHLLFFNGAVKPITNLCRPEQPRAYEEALSQLMSPRGLITLLIDLAGITLCKWGETMLREQEHACGCMCMNVNTCVYVVWGFF